MAHACSGRKASTEKKNKTRSKRDMSINDSDARPSHDGGTKKERKKRKKKERAIMTKRT
jgi:hypothetical protein